jgi:hypothetical protein
MSEDENAPTPTGSACSISPEAARKSLQEAYEREAAKYQRIIRIGDMAFGETEKPEHPATAMRKQAASTDESSESKPRPHFSMSHQPVTLSLDEARSQLPLAFGLPAWLPEGFAMNDAVQVILPGEQEVVLRDVSGAVTGTQRMHMSMSSVHVGWQDETGRSLNLHVSRVPPQPEGFPVFPSPVQPGSVTEQQVGGAPAALVTGQYGWRIASKPGEPPDWDKPEMMVSESTDLYWSWGDVRYSLHNHRHTIPIEDLLRIANSIPKP